MRAQVRDGNLTTEKKEVLGLRRTLGFRIADLREDRGMKLSEVAKAAGITPSALSQFEHGLAEPSITTLWRLSAVLGTSVLDIPGEQEPMVEVSTANAERAKYELGRHRYEILTKTPSRETDFYLLEIDPADEPIRGPVSYQGELVAYMIRGELEILIEGKTYPLNRGDSVWFPALQRHTLIPRGKSPSLSIWANTMELTRMLGKSPSEGLEAFIPELRGDRFARSLRLMEPVRRGSTSKRTDGAR